MTKGASAGAVLSVARPALFADWQRNKEIMSATMQQIHGQSSDEVVSTKFDYPSDEVSRATVGRIFEEASQLEPTQRQNSLAEAATRTLLRLLVSKRPLYQEFEGFVRQQFLKTSNLQGEIELLLSSDQSLIDTQHRYYSFIRGMFGRSGKTRQEFYTAMLAEAGIVMELGTIGFGEAAASFLKAAMNSVHLEHLLVFYSVELLIQAYAAANPGHSPLSDERVEAFYKYFEASIPLIDRKFRSYTKDLKAFGAILLELAPREPFPASSMMWSFKTVQTC